MRYSDERIDLAGRIQRLAKGRALADALRLDGSSVRFHLGTSLADLRVPVFLAPSLCAAFEAAVRDLFFLLAVRHRALLKDEEYDQLLLQDDFDSKLLRPVSWLSPPQVTRDSVRRAFAEAPELHPAIDAGLLASWIASGRPGRALVGALNALIKRALSEAQSGEGREPTLHVVQLALRRLTEQLAAILRKLSKNPAAARPLQGAVASGLLVAARLAVREAGPIPEPAGALLEAATQPLHWMGGPQKLAGSFSQAYGVAFADSPPRLDAYVQKIAQGSDVLQLVAEAERDLAHSEDDYRRAERAYALAAVRADLLCVLRLAEQGKAPPTGLDPSLYGLPGGLERTLPAPDKRKELQARAKAAAKAAKVDEARLRLEAIARAAKEWREDGAGLWAEDEVIKSSARAVVALACDVVLDKLLAQAAAPLAHRSGAESEDGVEAEYERGRLYLLGVEERPILRNRAKARQMAHLFCDVKDFTRRTALLKEAVVADFLSREFYTPILTAAARHHHGADHLGDKGGIYLNNLLGDAVSFSGEVTALVDLAEDIRAALHNYARRLEAESGSQAVSRAIAAIEERHAKRRAQLEQQLARTREAQRNGVTEAAGEPVAARIARLSAELAAASDQRQTELSLARGEKLEAGVFISYGSPPEVATFDDHVFGPIKVAIAEKINESARGTARNGAVRARVEALVQKARAAGKKDVSCPFSVLVSQPLSIPISGDAEEAVRARVEAGDLAGAQRVLEHPMRQFLARLAQEGGTQQGGDIYNGGIALSGEALRAYMAARERELSFFKREMPVETLHPSIRDRFVLPLRTVSLVAAVSPRSRSLQQLYVYAGRALFKGLEKSGGLAVYEIVPPSSPFFALVAQHHVPAWLSQPPDDALADDSAWEARTG